MQEAALYSIWQQLAKSAETVNIDGRRLTVLQAGRLNQSRGPDFLSSRFLLDDIVYQGDVECHLRRQDWYSHGHHLDRAYANVLLHVVAKHPDARHPDANHPDANHPDANTDKVTHQFSGRVIPTLYLPLNPRTIPEKCPLVSVSTSALQDLALARFRLKTHTFQKHLAQYNFAQIFYEAVFRTLGYPFNADMFQQLSKRLDVAWLQSYSQKFWLNEQYLLALYLGHAGLLPFKAQDAYGKEVVRIYKNYRELLPYTALDGGQWQFAAIRPANHPHLRLAAWCRLFLGHRERPWLFLAALLRSRLPFPDLLSALDDYFSIARKAYWETHYALDKSCAAAKSKRFFGKGRVMEIIINVLLPLFAAQAKNENSDGFFSYLEALYLWLPVQSPYPSLHKHFPWLGKAQKTWPAQSLYQAALHLRQNECAQHACTDCLLK